MAKWATKPLGDLCQVIGGGTPSKGKSEYFTGKIPWATIRDMKSDVIFETEYRINDEAVKNSSTKIIPAGNVVIATRVGLGKVCILGQDTAINQDLRGIIPRNPASLSVRFLFLWLKSVSHIIVAEGTGATVQGVKLPFVRSLKVPFPPLPEQRRIVDMLDEAFDGIATAKANAEKNLQNARALFESHLDTVFSQREEGWAINRLGDLCSIARGGSPRPIEKFLTAAPDGINWIKIGDATASDKYILKTKEKIIPEGAKRSRVVHDGDFLLSNSMSFGRPYIMRTSGCIHDGWLVLTDYASRLDQDFLYFVLGSQHIFRQFDRLAAGSTVRNLNIELASRVIFPVPPLKQQQDLAKRFDTISFEIKKLESIYRQKLVALETLRYSLLHQAFSGQL
jgi:type I restriction enzyme S subunit